MTITQIQAAIAVIEFLKGNGCDACEAKAEQVRAAIETSWHTFQP